MPDREWKGARRSRANHTTKRTVRGSVQTSIELDKNSEPARVYHVSKTGTFVWTHSIEDRTSCVACKDGKLPSGIGRGGR